MPPLASWPLGATSVPSEIGRAVDCAAVARALASSLAPPEADCGAPPWLRPDQGKTLRRLTYALAVHRGCLLADSVGTGKSYIALAAAGVWNGTRVTCCIVPPSLARQWEVVAAKVGVPIRTWSHARLSRGQLPPVSTGLVIIDESHHFRNPTTVRYATLAPWLSGRPTLLLSATPVVNRSEDLIHQLALAVRSDALRGLGVASLAVAAEETPPNPALGCLIVVGPESTTDHRPSRQYRRWQIEAATIEPALTLIRRLRLSNHGHMVRLLRGVFLRALASSPAALYTVTSRYRSLLLHAADANEEGIELSRSALREFTSGFPDQQVMWSLLPTRTGGGELALADLDVVAEILALTREARESLDTKAERLARVLADGRRTLVFAGFTSTVEYLRRQLSGNDIAWCTGQASGVGPMRVSREQVMACFRPDAPERDSTLPPDPQVLIATDIASEGLDLQRAERVIHYDLPWHEVGLEQRNGRVVRAGSQHHRVTIVRFDPPSELEEELAVLRALERKAAVATRLGVTASGRDRWRWRSRMAEAAGGRGTGGVVVAQLQPAGVLAGLRIVTGMRRVIAPRGTTGGQGTARADNNVAPSLTSVVWIDDDGWTDHPEVTTARLLQALSCHHSGRPSAEDLRALRDRLTAIDREMATHMRRQRWAATNPTSGLRRLLYRLRAEAVAAARARDGTRLGQLDDMLRFLSGGHTAGEQALIAHWSRAGLPDTLRSDVPPADPPLPAPTIELTGAILFVPG